MDTGAGRTLLAALCTLWHAEFWEEAFDLRARDAVGQSTIEHRDPTKNTRNCRKNYIRHPGTQVEVSDPPIITI